MPIRLSDGRIDGTFCDFSAVSNQDLGPRDLDMMRVFAAVLADPIGNLVSFAGRRPADDSFGFGTGSGIVAARYTAPAVPIVVDAVYVDIADFPAVEGKTAGTQYWKFMAAIGTWNVLPGAVVDDNQVRFTLVDGGTGDGDGMANGTIIDPGGPAVTAAASQIEPIPVMSGWGLALLSALLGLAAIRWRHRP